jgi:REP element-mobilizing transposase RayT
MPHSYVSSLFHCVFSTKERRNLITDELQQRLWPYMGGIARDNKMKALAVGGVADHAHLLLSIPSTISISKADRQSGFTTNSRNNSDLPGRKATVHSASVFRKWKKPNDTLRISESTIARSRTRKSLSRSWKNTALNMIRNTFRADLQPSLRD